MFIQPASDSSSLRIIQTRMALWRSSSPSPSSKLVQVPSHISLLMALCSFKYLQYFYHHLLMENILIFPSLEYKNVLPLKKKKNHLEYKILLVCGVVFGSSSGGFFSISFCYVCYILEMLLKSSLIAKSKFDFH